MIRWLLAICIMLALYVPSAFSQSFTVTLTYYDDGSGNAPLTTECEGATPLPDGRLIKIFQDIDEDGPDAQDTQPTVCNNPPNCLDGPPGSVNFNEFLMNGAGLGVGAGYFFTFDQTFNSSGELPSGSHFWYLRIYEADGETVLWTSSVFELISGPQQVNFSEEDWTCGQGGAQCLVVDETE